MKECFNSEGKNAGASIINRTSSSSRSNISTSSNSSNSSRSKWGSFSQATEREAPFEAILELCPRRLESLFMATIFSASGVPALKHETNHRTCRAQRKFQRKYQRRFRPIEHQQPGKGK